MGNSNNDRLRSPDRHIPDNLGNDKVEVRRMNPLKHSKPFRYELGHIAFKTPTVGDLMEFLSQFPPDMPVLATWEGTINSISFDEVRSHHEGKVEDACDVVMLDAETYYGIEHNTPENNFET